MTRGFLEPRNEPKDLLSRFESVCLVSAAAALTGTGFTAASHSALSGVLANVGVALLGAGAGSIARGLQWRRLLSRHAVDPHALVYYERGDYARIVQHVPHADRVDLLGISLSYALKYIKDNTHDYVRRVRHTRVLLPATREICDGRDVAQGTAAGALWNGMLDSHNLLRQMLEDHPTSFSVRFFSLQPYCALTRVDGLIWVSPYVTLSGRSCPVIAVREGASPELYRTYATHFELMWQRSSMAPER